MACGFHGLILHGELKGIQIRQASRDVRETLGYIRLVSLARRCFESFPRVYLLCCFGLAIQCLQFPYYVQSVNSKPQLLLGMRHFEFSVGEIPRSSSYCHTRWSNAPSPLLLRIFFFSVQVEYSYFSADYRMKIFLYIFLDYGEWHFWFLMYSGT